MHNNIKLILIICLYTHSFSRDLSSKIQKTVGHVTWISIFVVARTVASLM
jgi:hypothetical protein